MSELCADMEARVPGKSQMAGLSVYEVGAERGLRGY